MNIPMEPIRLTAMMSAQMLPKAIMDFATLAAIGGPIMAVILEITAKARKKVFYDKLAQQVTAMTLVLYLLFIICLGSAGGFFSRQLPWLKDWFINPASPVMMFYVTLGIALAGLIPYKYSWKKLKKQKPLHVLLGSVGALGGIATIHVATVIMQKFFTLQIESPTPAVPAVPFYTHFMTMPGKAGLCLAGIYLIMAMSFAAAASGLYLVLRRNKDDFGRDYYKFTLPVVARWALFPTLLQAAASGGVIYYICGPNIVTLYNNIPVALSFGISLLLTVICCAVWIVTWKSETPMRHKIGLGLAPVLVILAHATLMAGTMNLYLSLS
ncbi:hypothetical protein [Desulfovibrio sp. JC010]|uniref:hypothetical protein n=1 Tax=Desulfovibrio sp. JC010 TaxID=2593641 RepID=UPI0013D58F2B|nr:hypothetical protein [Desulfovibrio sp. JC010]NDV25493.1 hypothetical protein [Desulfovibrio sp. JC010]